MEAPEPIPGCHGVRSLSRSDANELLLPVVTRLIPAIGRLPLEIAHMIVSYIPRRRILTLARLDRATRDMYMPVLRKKMYRSLSFEYELIQFGLLGRWLSAMGRFLESILHKPELALNVKHFSLRAWSIGSTHREVPFLPPINETDVDGVKILAQTLPESVRDDVVAELSDDMEAHLGYVTVLVVAQLRNLETLKVTPEMDASHPLKRMLETNVSQFRSLKTVNLAYGIGAMNESNCDRFRELSILYLFNAPVMEDLTVSMTFAERHWMLEQLSGPARNLELNPPTAKCLKKLCFPQTTASLEQLARVFSYCPSLTDLFLEYLCMFHESRQIKARELGAALEPLYPTLENLRLSVAFSSRLSDGSARTFGSACLSESIGALKCFARLEELTISPVVLLGWDPSNRSSLVPVLPQSLKSLRLVDSLSYMDDYQWTAEALGSLLGEFDHDTKDRELFPSLKAIAVDVDYYEGDSFWGHFTHDMIVCPRCGEKAHGSPPVLIQRCVAQSERFQSESSDSESD
jgi:hypothetical protein